MTGGQNRSRLARAALLVTIASLGGNLLSFALALIAARIFMPSDFGAFMALTTVALALSTVAAAVQLTGARLVATDRLSAPPSILRVALQIAALALILGVITAPVLATVLNTDVASAFLSVAGIGLLVLCAAAAGIAQGRSQNRLLAALILLPAIGRLALGLAGMLFTQSVLGTIAGLTVGYAVAAAISALVVFRSVRPTGGEPLLASTLKGAHSLFVLFLFVGADLVLARIFLSPEASGAFAIGTMVSKIMVFLPQGLTLVVFPLFARRGARTALLAVILSTLAGSLVVFIVVFAAQTAVWTALTGSGSGEYASFLPLFVIEGTLFALLQSSTWFSIAREAWATRLIVWVVLVASAAVISVFLHASIEQIVWVMIVAGFVASTMALGGQLRSTSQSPG